MKTRNILIIIFVAIVVAIIFGVYKYGSNSGATPKGIVVFKCAEDKSITARFHLESNSPAEINLSDGRSLVLQRSIADSGAFYTNPDESIAFWNEKDTAFLEEKGVTTFKDCQASLRN